LAVKYPAAKPMTRVSSVKMINDMSTAQKSSLNETTWKFCRTMISAIMINTSKAITFGFMLTLFETVGRGGIAPPPKSYSHWPPIIPSANYFSKISFPAAFDPLVSSL